MGHHTAVASRKLIWFSMDSSKRAPAMSLDPASVARNTRILHVGQPKNVGPMSVGGARAHPLSSPASVVRSECLVEQVEVVQVERCRVLPDQLLHFDRHAGGGGPRDTAASRSTLV